MKSNWTAQIAIALFGVLLSICLFPHCTFGLGPFHISLTAGYEITESYSPGYDLTVLYNKGWGFRYVTMPDVKLTEGTTTQRSSNAVWAFHANSDLAFPMILRTIDYRSRTDENAVALDFITAYVGVGSGTVDAEISGRHYLSIGSQLAVSNFDISSTANLNAVAMGLYMGEKFIVLDGKLLYLRGKLRSDELLDNDLTFDHCLIQMSAGVFF